MPLFLQPHSTADRPRCDEQNVASHRGWMSYPQEKLNTIATGRPSPLLLVVTDRLRATKLVLAQGHYSSSLLRHVCPNHERDSFGNNIVFFLYDIHRLSVSRRRTEAPQCPNVGFQAHLSSTLCFNALCLLRAPNECLRSAILAWSNGRLSTQYNTASTDNSMIIQQQ